VLIAALVAAILVALMLAITLGRRGADVRRLTRRITSSDPKALASLDVDSFGGLDELAGGVYRLRSDLSRALAGVERQNALLYQIMNGLGEGAVAIDRSRRIVLANRRFAELFTLKGDLVGRPIGEVVRNSAVFSGFDRALAYSASTEHFTTAGRKIEMRAFPLPSHEIAAVALFIDVTQLAHLEDIRREFIADFSHEARTPLSGLKSAIESFELGAGVLTAEEEQHLRRIVARQLARLERLVDDLSELSRIESGDMHLELQDVDVRQLLDDLGDDFAERSAKQGLRLVIRGDGVTVRGDALRLQQVFSNLLDNAIKYGGHDTTIDLDIESTPDAALVTITDHGEGIAAEDRDRIFYRLYRVDKSRSQEVAGTGLGLAIAKHLVLLHGGAIDVESERGKGTTFAVRLPRK
jgi:two-component system, OmpR family, phosphate regulon sensor histidine kinase PhoR